MALPSNREINRCGDLLRSFFGPTPEEVVRSDEPPEGWEGWGWSELNRAFDVLAEFRSTFSYPLAKVTTGLRAMVKAETGAEPVVAQRLKRMDRIIGKLVRMPSMNVAQLEDIGGCRAVFASPLAAKGVEARIRRRWDVTRCHDYTETPKASGYRAVHLVVSRDGRRIEVQLRTGGQQQWADAVERFATAFRLPLKDEQGPPEVLNYFRVAGEGIYGDEYGVPFAADLLDRFAEVSKTVREWMSRQREQGGGVR